MYFFVSPQTYQIQQGIKLFYQLHVYLSVSHPTKHHLVAVVFRWLMPCSTIKHLLLSNFRQMSPSQSLMCFHVTLCIGWIPPSQLKHSHLTGRVGRKMMEGCKAWLDWWACSYPRHSCSAARIRLCFDITVTFQPSQVLPTAWNN